MSDWLRHIDPAALPAEAAAALEGARLLRVEVRQKQNAVTLYLEVGRRIPLEQRPALGEALRRAILPEAEGAIAFAVIPVLARPPFGITPAELLAQAWPDVQQQARQALPRVNGILDQAQPRLGENRIEIEFPNDALRGVVEKAGGREILEELLRRETGLQVRCLLTLPPPPPVAERPPEVDAGSGDAFFSDSRPVPEEPREIAEDNPAIIEYYEAYRARQAEPAQEVRTAEQPRTEALPDAVVRGKPIDPGAPLREISSLTDPQEPGKVVIQGEICAVETRDTRSGKQMIAFAVTDLQDTILCKCFRDPHKDPDWAAQLREGQFVRVRGRLAFDAFSNDLNLMADDINLVERPLRRDDHPGPRRVELHLHTTMSAMDGLCDPEEAIRRAINWGHRAIAITDHGVTQGFPGAGHVKLPEGFKVLYGMEAYVVDDGTPVIARPPQGVSLEAAEWVVLDIETTGFSAIADDIIEIGAVRLRRGQVVDTFQSFVRPTRPLSAEIQKLTHITPDMVAGAPGPAEVLRRFQDFCGDGILVAHNATFDFSFLRFHREKHLGEDLQNPVLDTLFLGRALLPHLKRFGLADLCKELQVPLENHHRADADARTAGLLLVRLLDRVRKEHPDVQTVADLNNLVRRVNPAVLKPHHVSILVQKQAGMKNLYRLVSRSHLEYFNRYPRVPRSLLDQYRDGLLLGSGCANGALFQALLRGATPAELEELAGWYDYLEVQPPAVYRKLVEEGQVEGTAGLQELVRQVIALGQKLGKPVVATGDVHFLDPAQETFREILKAGIGWNDAFPGPCYLRTTAEMLAEFSFLPPDLAEAIVITNPNRIADRVERCVPIPNKLFAPRLEGAEAAVASLTWEKARRIYGDPLPERVQQRIEKELQAIIGGGFAVVYYISHLLVKRSNELGYLVGSRGSVGSSFVAWAMGITEVNALPPHYVCPDCHHTEWYADGTVGSGYDLPDKPCPRCGRRRLLKDGQDIPFETFMGFKGDKVPDIDLNFSGDVQSKIQQYSIELLGGPDQVFKAGTVGTIAEKTAYGMVKNYLEERGLNRREAEVQRLARGLTGVKRTTGQHPGGMVVVPVGVEVEEVVPVQYPADDKESGWKTTHYDYHSFEQCFFKLDILGHDDPSMLRMLQDLTADWPVPAELAAAQGLEFLPDGRLDLTSIPMDDPAVLALFRPGEGVRVLGLREGDLEFDLGSVAVPEMGTGFVRRMLCETQPRNFSDLVRISGLSHGTDVWTNNAQELIRQGKCTLQTCIPTRDDIMLRLMYWNMEPAIAFKIMESVRKGKGLTPEMEEQMRARGVPDWYIWSCKQIKYMFPKAHAAAYVLSALRIAWFKVHLPALFYSAYFTIRAAGAVDADLLARGIEAVNRHVEEIKARGKDATPKEKEALVEYEVVTEALKRGIRFQRVDLARSDAVRYIIQPDGSLLCPFNSLPGLGDSAARAIVEARQVAPFQSIDDLRARAKLNKTIIELLTGHGCLRGLPEGNQLQFAF